MAVHFMFTASKRYDSVPVVGDAIALGELKDEIAMLKFRASLQGTRRMKEAFDFRVYDAETKEEILGAHTRVRKHSCVFVKRVPAFVVSQQQQQKISRPQENSRPHENSRPQENVIGDDFGEDVYSTPSVSSLSSERNSSGKPESENSNLSSERNLSGNSESGNSESGNSETSNLSTIELSEEVKNIEVVSANNLIVGPKVVEDREVVTAVEIPLELTCSLCHDIMKDPVLIPCCCISFCRNCVMLAFVMQQKCPKCGSSKCKESDLLFNRHMKILLDCFLKSMEVHPILSLNRSCSSQSLMSSISSEYGLEMIPFMTTSDEIQPSAASDVSNNLTSMAKSNINSSSQMAIMCGKRKPLTIPLNGAKKARQVHLAQVDPHTL